MASMLTRMKWSIMTSFSRQKAEVLALIFILVTLSLIVSAVWEAGKPMDGTFIDLSERHQMELVESFKKEKNINDNLRKTQEHLDRIEGRKEPRKDRLFDMHVNYVKGIQHDGRDFNYTKLLREGNDHRHLGEGKVEHKKPHFDTAQSIPEKKVVTFYDPVQDKMIIKPVIQEETDLKGGAGYCREYDISSEVKETFECVTLGIKPLTHICLYPNKIDVHISTQIRSQGIWEPHVVRHFQNVLYGDPGLVFIDIGANIGQYSLLAASMGHKVIAIEPFINNIKHLQKAAQLGHTVDKITVLQNAVSDKRTLWYLNINPVNQGGISIQMDNPKPDCIQNCKSETVSSIYMDDLLEIITFDNAIIKIDVEGQEHRAFRHSDKFFAKVFVPYIFMEWNQVRKYYGSDITDTEDKRLTIRLVTDLIDRGYHAYSSVTMERLNPKWGVSWTDDIFWKHEMTEFH